MAENIALGKTCAQSSTYPGDYACGNAVDDNTSTRQNTQYGANEWWKVDLGDSYNIESINMYKGPGFGPFPYRYHIQIADDWDFTSNVVNIITEENNSSESTTWDTDDFGSVNTRYLRVITHTSNQYVAMAEFRVYGSSGANEIVEDASLDLATYGSSLENLQAFLRAHDGVELRDLQATLEAFSLSTEDFSTLLIAMLESTGDFAANFETWATQYKDLAGDFDAKGQTVESLMSNFSTAKDKFTNLAAFLSATDGDVLKDLAAFLSVTDGAVLKNLGLSLRATKSIPAFRSNIAQRVSSVVSEVS